MSGALLRREVDDVITLFVPVMNGIGGNLVGIFRFVEFFFTTRSSFHMAFWSQGNKIINIKSIYMHNLHIQNVSVCWVRFCFHLHTRTHTHARTHVCALKVYVSAWLSVRVGMWPSRTTGPIENQRKRWRGAKRHRRVCLYLCVLCRVSEVCILCAYGYFLGGAFGCVSAWYACMFVCMWYRC